MITGEMKVSEVLKLDHRAIEILIAASPTFRKLNNPVLSKVMPRLVTVSQAAQIAGISLENLIQKLNAGLGFSPTEKEAPCNHDAQSPSQAKLGTPKPSWADSPIGFSLDVRPIIAGGGEPFSAIMAASLEVKPGERLILLAPFEPSPLYTVLNKKGFDAWCEKTEDDSYIVHFFRLEGTPQISPKPGENSNIPSEFDSELTVESNWEPPLPMQRILEELASLQPTQRLLVHHVRKPVHLFERLESDGHTYTVNELAPGQIDILIQKSEI